MAPSADRREGDGDDDSRRHVNAKKRNSNNNKQCNEKKKNNKCNNDNNSNTELGREALAAAEADLGETAKKRKAGLRELRQWVKEQGQLIRCRTDDSFLLRFLRFKKHNVSEAKVVLDKYVQMRTNHPEWFANLDIRDAKLRELMSSGYLLALPDRDENGRRVVFSRAAAMDTSRFTSRDLMRAHILAYETLLTDEESQVRGLTYVFDEREVNWSHVAIWSPSEISKAFNCCERSLPLRHQEIHFVHLPWTMSLVFQFAKSLLSQKLRERFETHSNFDKLGHAFPNHILPDTCAGGKRDMADLVDAWIGELEAKRDAVLSLDEMRYGMGRKVSSSSAAASSGGSAVLNVVGSVRQMEQA